MKKFFLVSSMFLSGNAVSHVSSSGNMQHASEHLLLAVLLVPVVWMIVQKMLSK